MQTYINCLLNKITHKPFGKDKRVEFLLQLIHSYVYALINFKARSCATYFITYIDHFTHFGYVYLNNHNMKHLKDLKYI